MSSLKEVKSYDDFTHKQWIALATKCGGIENVKAVLRDEKEVTIQDIIKIFFDKNGRCIPRALQSRVCDPDPKYFFDAKKINGEAELSRRLTRLHETLNIDTGITGKILKEKTILLERSIIENTSIANSLRGSWVPIVIPKLTKKEFSLELYSYLQGVFNSYLMTFSDKDITNHIQKDIRKWVRTVKGARCEKLIDKLKQESVIGLYFPNSLHGYSVEAAREQVKKLPENFVLSGLDTFTAIIMYPDILAVDNAPGLQVGGLHWEVSNSYLDFKVRNKGLEVEYLTDPHVAYKNYSSGLLFID